MSKAYGPRLSTVHLMADLLAVGVEKVTIIAPTRGTHPRPTRLRLYSGRDGWGQRIYSDFSISEARAFLASEQERAR